MQSSESTILISETVTGSRWLRALRSYFLVTALGHLVWEFAHMPLYTLWNTGTRGEIIFAGVHCTGGDLLIASATLLLALLIVGHSDWPKKTFVPVAIIVVMSGVGYTVFSEWLNIVVRKSWAYNDAMPIVPWLGAGLSPLLQWFVVPTLALWWARKSATVGAVN